MTDTDVTVNRKLLRIVAYWRVVGPYCAVA